MTLEGQEGVSGSPGLPRGVEVTKAKRFPCWVPSDREDLPGRTECQGTDNQYWRGGEEVRTNELLKMGEEWELSPVEGHNSSFPGPPPPAS